MGDLFNAIAKQANTTTRQLSRLAESTTSALNSAYKSVAENIPTVDSMLPFGNSNTTRNNGGRNNANRNNGLFSWNGANTSTNTNANSRNNGRNANANKSMFNIFGSNSNTNTSTNGNSNTRTSANSSNLGLNATTTLAEAAKSPWFMPLAIVGGLALVFLVLFIIFKDQILAAWENLMVSTGLKPAPKPPAAPAPEAAEEPEPAAVKPSDTTSQPSPVQAATSVVQKLLPTSGKEVFNISANDFNFYEAEPLCRALGAELATYDQVKEAYDKGADWCNYGWAQGQTAIFPTQKATFEKLQGGPEEQRNACGRPGVNGGYFDNPELRFGVNCYGVKPPQSANDERLLMERGTLPKTTALLKVDEQAQEFAQRLDRLGVLPFNSGNWSAV